MAYRFTNAVWRACIRPASVKLAAAVMADRADDNGYLYPSLDWIALQMSESRQTAKRAVAALKRLGLLSVVDRGDGGRGRTPTYLLNVVALESLAEKGVSGDPVSAVDNDDERGSPVIRKGVTGDPKGVHEWTPIHEVSMREPDAGASGAALAISAATAPQTNTALEGRGEAKPRALTPAEAREINRLHLATGAEATRRRLQEESDRAKRLAADPAAAAARELVRERFKNARRTA